MSSFRYSVIPGALLTGALIVGVASGAESRLECPAGSKVYGSRPRPSRGAEPLDPTANYAPAGREMCQSKDADGRLVLDGPMVDYYPDGSPMCRSEWTRGQSVDTATCWYVGGAVRSEQHYGAPGELAWSVDYDRAGAAVRKTYRDGRVAKEQHVDAQGAVVRAAQYDSSGAAVKQVGAARTGDNPGTPSEVGADNGSVTRSGQGSAGMAKAAPPVTLLVTGFSPANAEAIRAAKAALDERLAFLSDSAGVTVEVALAPGSAGSVVTVQERMAGTLEGLGFVPGVNVGGHRALKIGRARLVATYVNAWVGIGPVRAAAAGGNMALVEALGSRALLVQYVNDAGAVLNLTFTPRYDGNVSFDGAVYVAEGKAVTEVLVDPTTGLLPLATGADGRPTAAAAVYRFFGIDP